jgi:LmbE family N-acetylglucosaminyl deacetylase
MHMLHDEGALDVFLLAHPDDDIFVRPIIRRSLAASRRPVVVYLTTGAAQNRCDPLVRRKEAISALVSAGVDEVNIHFAGIEGGFPDGMLFDYLEPCFGMILGNLPKRPTDARVISHAWEGGHPDHDAAHLLARGTATHLACLTESVAFPSYRAADAGPVPFAVCRPLAANGPRCDLRIRLTESLETLAALRHFRSQWLTFLGLGPGLFFQYCVLRSIPLQPLAASCAPRRPMTGPLLAEKRFHADWDRCSVIAKDFLDRYAPDP